ncbi:hypothetical protein LBMAG30_26300 [Comamonadaceae bacterium]|nr:hypothetical protein LBMAG30_26300 [Comamonadaceae bacterium]
MSNFAFLQPEYAPWLVWPIVFIWGGAGGSLYPMAMIGIGAREKGITMVNSTALLVLTYTLGGLAASSLSGALIEWSHRLGFPLALISVAGIGLAVSLRTRHRQDSEPKPYALCPTRLLRHPGGINWNLTPIK